MGCYRTVIPYAAAPGGEAGHVLRFTAVMDAENGPDVRTRTVRWFKELALAVGLQVDEPPTEDDVLFEENEPRTEVRLEMWALEVRPAVFCMMIDGPMDSNTALTLDKEVYRLQRIGAKVLILDLGRVKPMGTAGLGVLLNVSDRLRLRLVKVPASANTMMETLGLEGNLKRYNSFQEVLTQGNITPNG